MNQHEMKITPTTQVGINTGRTRYRIECWTCKVVVHEATTGPAERVRQHFEGLQIYDRCMTAFEISNLPMGR